MEEFALEATRWRFQSSRITNSGSSTKQELAVRVANTNTGSSTEDCMFFHLSWTVNKGQLIDPAKFVQTSAERKEGTPFHVHYTYMEIIQENLG